MFVPEIVMDERCILVHNHDLKTPEAVSLAARFTRARLEHARQDLPLNISRIEIVFDLRGQQYDDTAKVLLNAEALGCSCVTFYRG
ncbi:hypothetical protein [Oceaniovalibus sp. ACAM 378]|uniref:hypothetical protein n=1 Tax=Oceaniovalibus sp. ACAM 378 TaxID=2599923 RepID=UPI0011D3A6B0|nr:hypothetical protein [Oceaniovalibus sp. ACAM 378]TYB83689.1 hypothetical protein FQ320_24365 [Oceaniovalibus sp. ACAM 378]